MTYVENSTVLVCDISAGFTHIAEALIPQCKRVLYFSSWQHTGFPTTKDVLPGTGIEGMERVGSLFDALSDCDWIFFPDVGSGDLQEYLRKQGFLVCGSGQGEELERDRWIMRTLAQKVGIQVAEAELVHGIDELREVLEQANKCYVKISWFRGDAETFCHKNPAASRSWLDELSLKLGPAGKKLNFIVEEPIEDDLCVEIGFDTVYAEGFPRNCLYGIEIKDLAFVGFTTPLPSILQDLQNKLDPILAAYSYRGLISTEFRITPNGAYLIDLTARAGSPPSEIQSTLCANLADVLYGVARGELVEPEYRAPYAAQLVLSSPWGERNALAVDVSDPSSVALHGHCVVDGQDFVVSPAGLAECGGAVGWGDSLRVAMRAATKAAEGVSGYQLTFPQGALKEAEETVERGRELGIDP